jgi:hypothetical protein
VALVPVARQQDLLAVHRLYRGVAGVPRRGLAGGPPIEHPRRFVIVLVLAMANLTLRSLSALRRSGERNAGLRGWVFTLGDLLLIAAGCG